ncbi:hypothetical protein PJ311_15050 [Bacillus sp. CLL-7-23]|uniref:Bacterial Pleckstrin homology domain-containing protein n=1 Tax=Bacillus changyiensis TaxID=3004103 RepID=A0ABT4X962_9BACI|nr:hypothetical protein [Bacillus changyiensis]MDA7027892.1 hypothetical protein [Bacillus changyiensis]
MKKDDKHAISMISYYKVERTIDLNQQQYQKKQYGLYLYQDIIITATHRFQLEHVTDISYRPLSTTGLLYLHTNQGVYPYEICSDPEHFIQEYQKLK